MVGKGIIVPICWNEGGWTISNSGKDVSVVYVWSLPVREESGVDVESRDGANIADPISSLPSKDVSRSASSTNASVEFCENNSSDVEEGCSEAVASGLNGSTL